MATFAKFVAYVLQVIACMLLFGAAFSDRPVMPLLTSSGVLFLLAFGTTKIAARAEASKRGLFHALASGSSKPRKKLLVELLSGLIGVPFCAVLIDSFGDKHWNGLPIGVGSVLAVLCASQTLIYLLSPKALDDDIDSDIRKGEAGDYQLVGVPYMLLWSFALLFSGVNRAAPGLHFSQTPPMADIFTWANYVLDLLLSVLLFDFLEIHGYRLSQIEHARSSWIASLVFAYKLVVAIGFITVLLRAYKRIRRFR